MPWKGRAIGSGDDIDQGIRFSAATHVGKVRAVNEDSIIALPEVGVWSVSDGMGGHSAGDYASQTVVEALSTLPVGLPPKELMEAVPA